MTYFSNNQFFQPTNGIDYMAATGQWEPAHILVDAGSYALFKTKGVCDVHSICPSSMVVL